MADGRRGATLVVVALVLGVLAGCSSSGSDGSASVVTDASAQANARVAARRFVATYVDAEGRVVRRDQGGDTPGEAQSYGLLLAQVAGDDAAFDRIWTWTAAHMLRPDGLIVHHVTPDGVVDDANSATDADLVIAWALLRASGPNAPTYHLAGTRLAAAVLASDTVTLTNGESVLAAGQWATGSPASLNPSYWILPAIAGLGQLTTDTRWQTLGATAVRLTDELTRSGLDLPPDWARADGSIVSPTPAPNLEAPDVRYSLDAQRIPVWLATSGDPRAVALSRAWWPLLSRPDRTDAAALDAGGVRLDERRHPLALVAAAATAHAAGHDRDRDSLLARAEALDAAQPSYYGSAWVALGRALLTTDLLAGAAS